MSRGTPGLRLLLVEDNPDDAELVVHALRAHGLDVDADRIDTYEGLERGLAQGPDLLLTDWRLPGMEVTEILRRTLRSVPDLPVIVVSGAIDEAEGVRLLALGATDLLLKDRLARLGAAVTAALAARRTAREGREAAERARWSWSLLCGFVEGSPAAICVESGDGSVLLENARYRALGGRVPAWLPGQRGTGGSSPAGTEEREVEIDERTFLAVRFPVPALDGGPTARGMILLDVSRQKEVERELSAARAELALQARELRAGNIELMELDRLKSDLVSTVSHELRTPLTSIIGYTELLEDGPLSTEEGPARRMLEVISRNGRRLLDLVDNLLVLARTDQIIAPSEDGGRRPVDVALLVQEVAAVLAPVATGAGLTLSTKVAPSLPGLAGDPASLERALLNLASNAIKFSRPGGEVLLRARAGEAGVVVEVTDHGIGMPPQEVAQLGTRFFRGDAARTGQVPGTGLGISVVAAIIDRHGGTLHYESTPGKGTTARVSLPVLAAPRPS